MVVEDEVEDATVTLHEEIAVFNQLNTENVQDVALFCAVESNNCLTFAEITDQNGQESCLIHLKSTGKGTVFERNKNAEPIFVNNEEILIYLHASSDCDDILHFPINLIKKAKSCFRNNQSLCDKQQKKTSTLNKLKRIIRGHGLESSDSDSEKHCIKRKTKVLRWSDNVCNLETDDTHSFEKTPSSFPKKYDGGSLMQDAVMTFFKLSDQYPNTFETDRKKMSAAMNADSSHTVSYISEVGHWGHMTRLTEGMIQVFLNKYILIYKIGHLNSLTSTKKSICSTEVFNLNQESGKAKHQSKQV